MKSYSTEPNYPERAASTEYKFSNYFFKSCFFKKLLFAFIVGLLLFFAVGNNLNVKAAGNEAYLITTNPAENSNNSINISWHCDTDSERLVEYTIATDVDFKNSLKEVGEKELETIYDSSSSSDVTSYRFKATLINLKEDTEYIYRIVGNSKSSVKSFRTGGASTYSAYVLSDVRRGIHDSFI